MIDMDLMGPIAQAEGLGAEESRDVARMMQLWRDKRPRNVLRTDYYAGHVRIKDLGIAIPRELVDRIDPRVDWPHKVVHALADRSRFDGFTTGDDAVADELREVVAANRMTSYYRRALIDELVHCCAFWTVTAAADGRPVVSTYPATSAVALWDDSLKTIRAGLVVAESVAVPSDPTRRVPSLVEVHEPDSVIVLRRGHDRRWTAEHRPHSMGRPLMEPMPHAADLDRPFGTSRISRAVMSITDDAIRHRARMEIAAESSTLPQMWLLGTKRRVTDDGNRYSASMGAINEVTKDADGDVPSVWQSSQLQMEPLSAYWRLLACAMSEATNVPVSFFGISSDNPSSADAISAALEPLVIDARNLNRDNGEALRSVALMALAILHGTDYATERASSDVSARFLSPAFPSVVSQSDAILKQVQAIPKLADSDVVLETLDYTAEQVQRINSDHNKAAAQQSIFDILDGDRSGD